MTELRIWVCQDRVNFVIARDPEDATAICVWEWGYQSAEELAADRFDDGLKWTAWPDDQPFPFTTEFDEALVPADLDPGAIVVPQGERAPADAATFYRLNDNGKIYFRTDRKLPAEWIEEHGRGYFACTEQ